MEIKRVFLTGYMGSGKSFIGQKFSDFINWKHVDLDQRISANQSQSISDIFETNGEQFFRSLEYTEVSKLCNQQSFQVISLGGGAFAQENINDLLCNDRGSIVVYLKFSAHLLALRLQNEKLKRPIIKNEDNLEKFIAEHLEKRTPFYERADLIIVDEDNPDQIIKQISTYLNFRNQKSSTI